MKLWFYMASYEIDACGLGRDNIGGESGRVLQENVNYKKWDEIEKGENANKVLKSTSLLEDHWL